MFSSLIVFDSIRLLHSNFKMRLQGVDIEQLLAHFGMNASEFELNDSMNSDMLDEKPSTSLMARIFSLRTIVHVMRFLYQMSLILMSVLSLVICTYITDSMFGWLNPNGNVYAVQLMPEAKVLSEKLGPNS